MNDARNIRRYPVNIYLGEADANPGNLAEWDLIGWCEGKQTKLASTTAKIKLNGFQRGLGKFFEFVATGLQTGAADNAILAQYDNRKISILLTNVNDATDITVLKNYHFNYYPEYTFADDTVRKNVIRATLVTRKLFKSISIIDPPSGELVTVEELAII